jgi:hypothetical protein
VEDSSANEYFEVSVDGRSRIESVPRVVLLRRRPHLDRAMNKFGITNRL